MKRKRHKINKLRQRQKLKEVKKRIPIAPFSRIFKSIKDYNRKNNKEVVKEELSN